MKAAIAKGADVNQREAHGLTPLQVALMTTSEPYWCGTATATRPTMRRHFAACGSPSCYGAGACSPADLASRAGCILQWAQQLDGWLQNWPEHIAKPAER